MILLQASHIQKSYHGHPVLTGANLTLQQGERAGLVGANGAGKSTLLRILTGQEAADAGEVSVAKGVRIGYVAQWMDAADDETVFGFAAAAVADLFAQEAALRALEAEMANPDVYADERRFADLAARYDRLRQAFEAAGGYAAEARVRRVLAGLAFPAGMHGQPVRALSGGQKTRLALARLLVAEPDVLILDEPTNYLDTETLTWLEGYLQSYPGAVLVVAHDRYFLDKVATVIYELEHGRTTRFPGNYSAYVEQKAALLEEAARRYEAQQAEIARIEAFIQRNIARASTSRSAQSRRKLLARMIRLDPPTPQTPRLALRFTPARESGKDVLTVRGLVTGYPGQPLAGPMDLHVARGQRIAIVGPNGVGKTTLLKTLAGLLPPLAGEVVWGAHVDLGYYDQELAGLDETKTVLAQVWDEQPQLDRTTVRTALGRFLFRGEDVEKPVAALSGGERSRLALCRLMLRQPNVLLLDEPTNHLDLMSKEVLEDALADYEGTVIFVSHDRYFIDTLATHVLALDPGGWEWFIGNYSEFAAKRQEAARWADAGAGDGAADGARTGQPAPGGADGSRTTNRPAGGAGPQTRTRPVRSAELRKLRERVAAIEARIAEIERAQAEMQAAMVEASLAQDFTRTQALDASLRRLTEEHDELLAAWEEAMLALEACEQKG
ncbi:multidrug ABC transporter ATP-binding protein [Alicyclobacillus cellulosilyticus]|uniref:Multidrug ABC transporter ATP-binding protein n=1 Tax=Alicyclobacillus cellulosilyticus TaxID=1003997 RepID=A0A917KBD9_9BACL|nr:ABC-F family ATP-binding cassette domain-containing protein [Alicyclobacillus cellulosilyticus]GGJ04205.1 multidrug ABC transporter ATP-binding protein [Alicyclobacillus cellulosilyticus]